MIWKPIVLLSTTSSFIRTQSNGFMFRKLLYIFILPIDGTLTGTTTSGQRGPGSNDNEEVAIQSAISTTPADWVDEQTPNR